MLAAVQRCEGDEIIAVQRTELTWDGTKAVSVPRRTVGPLRDGAVRIAEATDMLGLAEGVETALAAWQLSKIPCWASLGAGRMHNVRIPDTVRELHIFADDDPAGRSAAERTSTRHIAEGRCVLTRFPPNGLNDYCAVAESLLTVRRAA
jgi:hypothetical protein